MIEFPSFETFVSWLEGQGKDEVVARHWNSSSCPLCRFLQAQGWPQPAVFGTGRWSPDRNVTQPEDRPVMPSWALEFVYWVDRSVPCEVTASECLDLVRSPQFDPTAWEGRIRAFIKPATTSMLP